MNMIIWFEIIFQCYKRRKFYCPQGLFVYADNCKIWTIHNALDVASWTCNLKTLVNTPCPWTWMTFDLCWWFIYFTELNKLAHTKWSKIRDFYIDWHKYLISLQLHDFVVNWRHNIYATELQFLMFWFFLFLKTVVILF